MKNFLLTASCIALFGQLSSQEWTNMLSDPDKNFYEVRDAFNEYWKDKDRTVKGQGYKQFKRWEHFMEPRVYPTGDLSLPSNTLKNFEKFKGPQTAEKSMASVSSWTAVGPMGAMTGTPGGFP